ncbi:MAG: hypothetical protein ACREQP_04435 [Candidatus Binatia bacterium]
MNGGAPQQPLDIPADIMIIRAWPEVLGVLVVAFQRDVGNYFQIMGIQFHSC